MLHLFIGSLHEKFNVVVVCLHPSHIPFSRLDLLPHAVQAAAKIALEVFKELSQLCRNREI